MTPLSRRIAAVTFGLLTLHVGPAFSLTLESNLWHLISVPGDSDQSIAELFDGQLEASDYDDTWAIFLFDSDTQAYAVPDIGTTLNPGDAFWIQHSEQSAIEMEVNLDARTVPLTVPVLCASPIGCYEIALPTGEGEQWSLLGTPFPEGVLVSDILVVTNAGPCQVGCTLAEAGNANLTANVMYDYVTEDNEYLDIGVQDYLEASEGYWFATAIPDEMGPAFLLFPTFCTPFL